MADEFDTSDTAHPRPISAAFQEGGSAWPRRRGSGSAFMLDADGDHAYEQMTVQGSEQRRAGRGRLSTCGRYDARR